jgi:hypothetical protein
MENQALENWVRSAIENVIQVKGSSELSLNECIIYLGKDIFNIITDDTSILQSDLLTSIIENIEDHFALPSNTINLDDIHIQLKYFLIAAVSQSCENQSSYIQNILGLEPEYQSVLMEIIKTGTTESSNELNILETETSEFENVLMNNNNDEEAESQFPPHQQSYDDLLSKSKSKQNLYSDESIDNICNTCYEKSIIISNHIKSIECMKARENELEMKFKTEIATNMNKLVDAEVLLIEKDQLITSLKEQIDQSSKQLHDLDEKLSSYKDYTTKVLILQDQIDVLIPQTEKVQALEIQISRLREKLDEQSNLKQQLKQESQAHSETHKVMLTYEAELDINRKYKPLLDEYRAKHAESLIEIQSLNLKLQQQYEKVTLLQNDRMNTVAGENNGLLQAHQLAEELHEANEKIRALERVQGVGEGIRY